MEWKKNINTNLGITIILVFAALFTIIDFYVVCSHIDGYPFGDINSKTVSKVGKTVVDDKEVIDVQDSILVYDLYDSDNAYESGDLPSIDKYYKYNGLEYHFIVNGKIISVNGVEIFRTNTEIRTVLLVNDIIAVLYNYHDLTFVDMKGNVLKTIGNTYDFDVDGVDFTVEIDNHDVDGDEIYDKVSFSYLGDGKFSEYNVIEKNDVVEKNI